MEQENIILNINTAAIVKQNNCDSIKNDLMTKLQDSSEQLLNLRRKNDITYFVYKTPVDTILKNRLIVASHFTLVTKDGKITHYGEGVGDLGIVYRYDTIKIKGNATNKIEDLYINRLKYLKRLNEWEVEKRECKKKIDSLLAVVKQK